MAFESSTLKGSPRLDQAGSSGPSVKRAPPYDDAEAVKRIQRGLRDIGYPMTKSFPNGPTGEPDGRFGDETYEAVLDLQKKRFPNDPTQWDGRVGPKTLGQMDGMLKGKEKVDPKPPDPKPDNKCTPKDDTIPTGAPYSLIPPDTMTMLHRSYRERDDRNMNLYNGFDDLHDACPQSKFTFKEVLDKMMAHPKWGVVNEMRNRCEQVAPGLWGKIRWLHQFYDFGNSRGIWCCMFKDSVLPLRDSLKNNKNFCADMFIGHSTHQKHMVTGERTPSQCYRELNRAGDAGLHICFMVTSEKASEFGEWHNLHIDPHQIGGEKGDKAACWYVQTKHHFGDVGEWCVGWFLDNYGDRTEVKAACFILGIDPKNKKEAYRKLMAVVGDYDTFVDMADHPERYRKPFDPKRTAVIALAQVYKKLYITFMPPQWVP